jgi:hypothetical protein
MAYENSAEINVDVQPHDSPHVMAATNVRRGMTPGTWDSTDAPDIAGIWESVDNHAGRTDASMHVTSGFDEGPGYWQQT